MLVACWIFFAAFNGERALLWIYRVAIWDFRILIFTSCLLFRDAPEATGDEPDDADFETPKVYELVRGQFINNFIRCSLLPSTFHFHVTRSSSLNDREQLPSISSF